MVNPASPMMTPGKVLYGDLLLNELLLFGEINVYKFEGEAGDVIIIWMPQVTTELDPRIRLYGPDNMQLISDYDSSYASIAEYALPETGVYTIYCDDYGANNSGDYQIEFIKLE